MKLLPTALLALFLVAGCATSRVDPIPKDGAMSRKITWVITEDTQTHCRNAGGRRPLLYQTLGCAVWKDPTNCVIYARRPRTEDDRRAMETLGHEMLHCFAGHFHHQP